MGWDEQHIVRHHPLLHTGFWATWVVVFTLLQNLGQGSEGLITWFTYYLVTLPVFVIHTYLIAYWLVPATFLKKKYLLFSAGLFLFLLVFSCAELLLSNELVFNRNPSAGFQYLTPKNVVISGIGNHYIILVFMAIKVGNAWYRAQSEEQAGHQRNLATELEIENYRFRPMVMHHLMKLLECNLKSTSGNSPEIIIRLAGFLNVFLADSGRKEIYFPDEVKLIEMYVEIYSVALPGSIPHTFSAEGDFNSFYAPAFLFLPVLDVALTRGMKENSISSCAVSIEAEGHSIHFSLNIGCKGNRHGGKYAEMEVPAKKLQLIFPGRVSFREENRKEGWHYDAVVFFPKNVTKKRIGY